MLTYCLNIHATETWAEVEAALDGPARAVKAAVSPEAPFPLGLRLSNQALEDLRDPAKRARLKQLLHEGGFEALTMNGFPYGPFHGTRVKEEVYLPDWRSEDRVRYTCELADLMVEIAPQGATFLSLSTVPGAFKPNGAGAEAQMAENFLRVAGHCAKLEARTGVRVAIAVEPEPFCFLETIEEAAAFFGGYLYSDAAARRLAELAELPFAKAKTALPDYLGLCYDVCHAAVEFEDPAASLQALRDAGVPVHKLQLSAALRIEAVTPQTRDALRAYVEPTYLHQVVSRDENGALSWTSDLPEALARGAQADGEEWRVHFHVPLFARELGAFTSTQDFLAEILALHAQDPISAHLEIETYTWDVLPAHLREGPVDQAIARELNWVRERLNQ